MVKRKSKAEKDALLVEQQAKIEKIKTFLAEKIPDPTVCSKLAVELMRGTEDGLELEGVTFDQWFEERFKPQVVWLSKDDYARALVRALWLARTFAGSDYGSSRQRDMAQVWTDTARGFLGEIAVSSFLKESFGVQTEVDTTRGKIEEYLPTDIAKIMTPEGWRPTRARVSIKTTKFNGRWLDSPGAQFARSDYFALVKIGISRDHFVAFLKSADFIGGPLFAMGKSLGELNDSDAKLLLSEIPDFYPLPAYVAGYIGKEGLNLPIHMLNARVKGRKNKKIIVEQGVGLFTPEAIQAHPSLIADPLAKGMPIEIEPIIKSFTGQKFLAHSGALHAGTEAWVKLIQKL